MTRPRATIPRRRRQREGWGVLLVIVLAAICGLLAAHFGTHRAWEKPSASTATSTSVPFIDPQRIS